MWTKDPRCCYCGRETVFVDNRGKHRGKNPKLMATIEHVKSRLNPTRQHDNQWLLSCWECNFERGRDELMTLLDSELQRRSNSYPICYYPFARLYKGLVKDYKRTWVAKVREVA